MSRQARLTRKSKETDIEVFIDLDGEGRCKCDTGFGMFDHMLELLAFWGRIDLEVNCKGDLHIDAHHSMEDTGLLLGRALLEALGNRVGIRRTGYGRVPMDEALAESTIDLSGRPWLVWRGDELLPPAIAHEEKDVWREFYKAFASGGRMNIHIDFLYGKNGHHLLESAAKSTGVALASAVEVCGAKIPSTKGGLD